MIDVSPAEKANITDRKAIEENLALGEHVKKGKRNGVRKLRQLARAHRLPFRPDAEVLAMLSLKKFRHLKRSYYDNEPPRASSGT